MSLPTVFPLVLPYQNIVPILQGPISSAGTGSALLGRVTLGARAVLADHAVMRADGHVIEVGDDFFLGARSTIHIAHAVMGTRVGHRVTVGRNAVVHGCTVEDDCVIGDDAVVLDGAVVGAGAVVASGSVVFSRTVLAPGHRYAGVPAVAVGPVDAAELRTQHAQLRSASSAVAQPAEPASTFRGNGPGYIAMTVTGHGRLAVGPGSGVWYGCQVDASQGRVAIGAGSNVQDNSVMRSEQQPVVVGSGCTVGHNVVLHDCTVGDRVLVGMGSRLAPGTVVGDDVLVAAGASTLPGQQLLAGWMWGGRPARAIAALDEKKRAMIQSSGKTYVDYAAAFTAAEAAYGGAR